MSSYQRLRERYAAGDTPWDHEQPPPELMAAIAPLTPGRALDLGCGYGRAAVYMARRGWTVDAIDFVDLAIAGAERRAAAAGVADLIDFHISSVTDLPFLDGPYDFALDVGCMHNFDDRQLAAYRSELARLLRPGALYLLFAHLRTEPIEYDEDGRPRWLSEKTLYDLFLPDFRLDHVEHGITAMPERPPWPSAWVWFYRRTIV
jgi:SAM-dependent methyltransferase